MTQGGRSIEYLEVSQDDSRSGSRLFRAVLEFDGLVASVESMMLMIPTGIPFGGIIEQEAPSIIPDLVNYIDGEFRIRFEACSVDVSIPLSLWVHQLASCNFTD